MLSAILRWLVVIYGIYHVKVACNMDYIYHVNMADSTMLRWLIILYLSTMLRCRVILSGLFLLSTILRWSIICDVLRYKIYHVNVACNLLNIYHVKMADDIIIIYHVKMADDGVHAVQNLPC